MKTFTVKEVIDAIRKNGLPKEKGYYFKTKSGSYTNGPTNGEVVAACAIGQAAINLGVTNPNNLSRS